MSEVTDAIAELLEAAESPSEVAEITRTTAELARARDRELRSEIAHRREATRIERLDGAESAEEIRAVVEDINNAETGRVGWA